MTRQVEIYIRERRRTNMVNVAREDDEQKYRGWKLEGKMLKSSLRADDVPPFTML